MKTIKIIGLLLVVVFSITTYNLLSPTTGIVEINILCLINLGGFASGVVLLFHDSNAQSIAKTFTIEILQKNGLYVDNMWHINTIKLKGSISNHQTFCSYESDSLSKKVKIFGYHGDSSTLKDFSYFTGLKRKTVLYQDYVSPNKNWINSFGDSAGCKIFFVIWTIEKRKLLSFDVNNKQVHYEPVDRTSYPETIIEVYSR